MFRVNFSTVLYTNVKFCVMSDHNNEIINQYILFISCRKRNIFLKTGVMIIKQPIIASNC